MMVKKSVLDNLELVIFDVDGTMYDQSKLRKYMAYKMFKTYIFRPWKLSDLVILYHFRKERAKRVGYEGYDLEAEQYEWCANKVNRSIAEVKEIIDKWIFEVPKSYLPHCIYPGVAGYLLDLKRHGIKTAIYSDYPSENKMKWMNLNVDLQVNSTANYVNSMKPSPIGLQVILKSFNICNKNNCIFIGDRLELDGQCALNAEIPFLLVDKQSAKIDFFTKLSYELNNFITQK